jgi:peptidylprolyl isomerase
MPRVISNFSLSILLLALAFLPGYSGAQEALVWRQLDPANTVYADTTEGQIIFELNPVFAPVTVAQFKKLIKEDFYRSLSFYRVIEGFVAQGGDESDINTPNGQPQLPAEFEIEIPEELKWTSVQKNDLFAGETGFIDSFAAARDEKSVWLTHCPGVLAMARNTEPDTGSTDFYVVIGQAPRYLDRNLTIFGRVVIGMDTVQRIRRGPPLDNGVIEKDEDRSRIRKMTLGSDIPAEERKEIYVMDTNGQGFIDYLAARRNRADDFFFHKPPKVLDVCQIPVTARMEKATSPDAR